MNRNPWYYSGTLRYKGRDFRFVFRFVYTPATGWRAYIVESPSYEGRSEGIATHRLVSDRQYYICWSTRVDSRDDMQAIADIWARATVMYIVDGGSNIADYVPAIQAGNA